jgi:hypothetical protein
MARNNWENKDKEYAYLSSAATTNKDAYFKVSSLVSHENIWLTMTDYHWHCDGRVP